jgi:spermidine/putrescine transport system permease protein
MTTKKSIIKNIFLVIFYICLYLPIIYIFYYSIINSDGKFSFCNYYKIFERKDIIEAFFNSFFIGFSSVIFSIFVSLLGIAYLFFKGDESYALYFLMSNLIIPEIVLAISLLLFFTITSFKLGFISLFIAHTTMGIGYVFPFLYQRWKEIDNNIVIAAYDLGASSLKVWQTIILPMFKNYLISSGVLVFILSFDDYLLSYFCSSSEYTTISMAILSMLRTGISPELQALSAVLIILSTAFAVIYFSYFISTKKNKERKNIYE